MILCLRVCLLWETNTCSAFNTNPTSQHFTIKSTCRQLHYNRKKKNHIHRHPIDAP